MDFAQCVLPQPEFPQQSSAIDLGESSHDLKTGLDRNHEQVPGIGRTLLPLLASVQPRSESKKVLQAFTDSSVLRHEQTMQDRL